MPCGIRYVYAASRKPSPLNEMPVAGEDMGAVMLTMATASPAMATIEPSAGGAPLCGVWDWAASVSHDRLTPG